MDIDASQKGRWGFRTDRVFNTNDPSSYPFTLSLAIGTAQYFKPSWNPSVFAQDTWQVRDNLTLNFGVRYDVDNTILVGNELVDSYNQMFVKNYGGTAPLSKVQSDLNNVQPRVGFVWVPAADRRTTVRGSVGLFYDQNHFNYNDTYINQTLLTQNRVTLTDNNPTANPFWNPADPTGSATKLRAYLAQQFPRFPDLSILGTPQQTATAMAPDFHVPYTMEATTGATHLFANKLALQADYVYSHGYDGIVQRNINLAQVNGQFVSIDPRFSAINMYQNLGWIHYHALVSRIEYRGTKLRAGTSYTLSKATSNSLATGVGGGAATNPLDLSIDIGPTNEDRRHVVASDFAYVFRSTFSWPASRVIRAPCRKCEQQSDRLRAAGGSQQPACRRRVESRSTREQKHQAWGPPRRDRFLGNVQRHQHDELPAVPRQPAVLVVRLGAGRRADAAPAIRTALRFLRQGVITCPDD